MSHNSRSSRTRKLLIQQLESLQRCGVETLGKSQVTVNSAPVPVLDNGHGSPDDQASDQAHPPNSEPLMTSPTENKRLLASVQAEVAKCTLCSELADSRTQTVFGVGNPQARLCFFGEAPGADEDRQGEPFVGRAGQLLTDIIQKGMGLERSDVYILNVLKCRPPGNRNPMPAEIDNCRPFFERQLEIIQPDFICCLGAFAAQTLLDTTQSVGRLRGTLHDYCGIKVVVTYHPAYLLRNPTAKKATWQDIQLLMEEMELPIPPR